jgi:replicative DNA helicase
MSRQTDINVIGVPHLQVETIMILSDPSAERALLSTICQYGESVFLEISDLISETTFTIDSNKIIFQCLKHILEQNANTIIDIGILYSAAKDIGVDHILQRKEEVQHLKAILDFPANKANATTFAAKIKKLEIARKLYNELEETKDKILEVSGQESITQILSIAEDGIFNFSSKLTDSDNGPAHVATDLEAYIDNLINNPIKQVGISTGFPVYDSAIGGGLRKSTINVIAARPKTGKTLLADNMGFYIANKLKIPVLNLDTEMTKEDHLNRLIAMITEIEISKIETGKFTDSTVMIDKVNKAVEELKETPLFYKPIAGKPFDEQLSIMKRWIVKEVGLNTDGSAKPCVIFYDYLKLMDSQGIGQDMKEYQVLGFMMTSLHNFACKYQLPIVAFVQLNRDGITKETTDTASGSDRIIWLCSNFTIFKRKSDEEIADDGSDSGNRKLIPVISRHGPGIEDNDYINCHMKGWCAKIIEGKTRIEIMNNNGGFVTNDKQFGSQQTENEKIDFI